MDTPRKTKLYNQIAKDYKPKHAAMMICRHIEGLEARIEGLEDALSVAAAEAPESKAPARSAPKAKLESARDTEPSAKNTEPSTK